MIGCLPLYFSVNFCRICRNFGQLNFGNKNRELLMLFIKSLPTYVEGGRSIIGWRFSMLSRLKLKGEKIQLVDTRCFNGRQSFPLRPNCPTFFFSSFGLSSFFTKLPQFLLFFFSAFSLLWSPISTNNILFEVM